MPSACAYADQASEVEVASGNGGRLAAAASPAHPCEITPERVGLVFKLGAVGVAGGEGSRPAAAGAVVVAGPVARVVAVGPRRPLLLLLVCLCAR